MSNCFLYYENGEMMKVTDDLVKLNDVLEIIDKYAPFIFGNGLSEANQIILWERMHDAVAALEGGKQE